ncbi:MAG: TadG family pilus assembly protein [Parasphingorhabdus sp.]
MLKKFIRKIIESKHGNVLALTSMAAPVVIGFAGLSIDVGYGYYSKSQLRGATELTALDITENFTKPNNFSVTGPKYKDQGTLVTNGLAISKDGLPVNHGDAAIKPTDIEVGEWNVENKVFTPGGSSPIVNAARVKGELSKARNNKISTFFGGLFGFNPDLHTDSFAIAPLVPEFHFLNPSASGALRHSDGSGTDRTDLDIGDVWINSDADDAMIASPVRGKFGAPGAFIKGGTNISGRKYYEDLFRLPDLLAAHPEPARPAFLCDHNNLEYDQPERVILWPGAYCGGLKIKNSQLVIFVAGTYQFLDGPLEIESSPLVYGNEIFFHFDGPGAAMDINNSSLFLAGQTSGFNKGFLIFSSRNTTNGIAHQFEGSRGEFVGTFYAPDNHISIIRSGMNGKCNSLCLVADTMSVTGNSFLNWYHGFNSLTYFKNTPRVAPTVLEPYLTPYLISGS